LSRSGVKLEASGLFELHVYPLPAEFAKEKYSFVCSILAATAVANESAPWPKFRSLDDFPLIFSYHEKTTVRIAVNLLNSGPPGLRRGCPEWRSSGYRIYETGRIGSNRV